MWQSRSLFALLFSLLLITGITWPGTPPRAQSEPSLLLVTSIKPLALILGDMLGARVKVQHLVPVGTDPHHYALKVSDRLLLSQADLVVWTGPELERFLVPVVDQLSATKVITLSEIPNLDWPDSQAQVKHNHTHSQRDPHLWLNPQNALKIQHTVALRLSSHSGLDLTNEQAHAEELFSQLDKDIQHLLHGIDLKYGVYHDSYGHFVQHYGLRHPVVIAPGNTASPGARHLMEIEQQLQDATCLLVEPGHDNRLTHRLAQTTHLPLITVDPLGIRQDISSYRQLLMGVAEAFASCDRATAPNH